MLRPIQASNMSITELANYINNTSNPQEDYVMLSKALAKKALLLSKNTEETLAHIVITAEKAISEL